MVGLCASQKPFSSFHEEQVLPLHAAAPEYSHATLLSGVALENPGIFHHTTQSVRHHFEMLNSSHTRADQEIARWSESGEEDIRRRRTEFDEAAVSILECGDIQDVCVSVYYPQPS